MFKVSKFLCYELDKGGKIIGWIGKICCIIPIVILTILLVIGVFMSCENVMTILQKHPEIQTEVILDCYTAKLAFGIISVIIIAVYALFYYIYSLLIRGIDNRNHCQVRPALICEVIAFIICIAFAAYSENVVTRIYYLFWAALSFYIAVVLYSIYSNIKSGKSNPQVAQYSGP
ncbi:uncharacterized protein [Chironomus tepperi]|uniref:uncharacterized protein n=1 Tax=Chironomus tepperi TaxID=113505 RepID=UPI00391F63CB